jgi:hypothetical protein
MTQEFAKCECCLKPIHDGDVYGCSDDGAYTCEEHTPTLADAIEQHEEIMQRVPWDPGELGYDSRDEMKKALNLMKYELAKSGDRKLLAGE